MGRTVHSRALARLTLPSLLVALVLLTAGCDWASFGYDLGNTRASAETTITPDNLHTLQPAWKKATGSIYNSSVVVANISSTSVANNVLYEVANLTLQARNATTGALLWKASVSTPGFDTTGADGPTVANGMVYVPTGLYGGSILAFDEHGKTGCTTTTPVTCQPLFHTIGLPPGYPPIVSGGYLYSGGYTTSTDAAVWDANGVSRCAVVNGLKQCSPLATYVSPVSNAGASAIPSLDATNHHLFVPQGNKIYAYPTYGSAGCTGTSTTTVSCSRIWTYQIPGTVPAVSALAAVRNNLIYTNNDYDKKVTAFDALGVTGCTGSPKTCAPMWQTTAGPGGRNSLAVNDTFAFTQPVSSTGPAAVNVSTHKVTWTGTKGVENTNGGTGGPVVVGGVLFIGSSSDFNVYGYNAAGCGAATCAPQWHYATSGAITKSPVVSNGMVYVPSADGYLYAFKL